MDFDFSENWFFGHQPSMVLKEDLVKINEVLEE